MTFPRVRFPPVPPNTVVPEDKDLFIPYFNRTYEDLASSLNNKDNIFFPIAITDTAENIPNIPNFGSFIICVSGKDPVKDGTGAIVGWLPTITASLCKSSAAASGSVAVLGSQAGVGTWSPFVLTITSTATNFQIAHNNTGVTGNFNIRFIGTQM